MIHHHLWVAHQARVPHGCRRAKAATSTVQANARACSAAARARPRCRDSGLKRENVLVSDYSPPLGTFLLRLLVVRIPLQLLADGGVADNMPYTLLADRHESFAVH